MLIVPWQAGTQAIAAALAVWGVVAVLAALPYARRLRAAMSR
jgi:uncharacterized membrane protein